MVEADNTIYDMDESNISDDEAREFLETVWTGRDYEDATHDYIREELWKLRDDRSWEVRGLEKVADFNETIPEMSNVLGISEKVPNRGL